MARPARSAETPPPLQGVQRLNEGDVRSMLRAAFWLPAKFPDQHYATSTAALCGLRALAGITMNAIVVMEEHDALPAGRDTVRVTIRGSTHELPVTPALAELLREWKGIRCQTGSSSLFVDRNGRKLTKAALVQRLRTAGPIMGLRRPLWRLLKRFFGETLDRDRDLDSIHCYESIVEGQGGDPTTRTTADLARLLRRTDPFEGSVLAITDDDAAFDAARRHGSRLPRTFDECRPRPEKKAPPPVPADSAFIAEVSGVKWPRDRYAANALRSDMYLRHRAEISALMRNGSLPNEAAARLFGLQTNSYKGFKGRVRRLLRIDPKPVGRRPGPLATVPMSEAEAARWNKLSHAPWPPAAKHAEFRRGLLGKHAPFAFKLVEEGKIRSSAAARAFGISVGTLYRLKSEFADGTFARRGAEPTDPAQREDIVLQEYRQWPADGSFEAFVGSLRNRHGIRMSRNAVEAIILRDTPEQDRRRVAAIAAQPWPDGDGEDAVRRRLLGEHMTFVADLIQRKGITITRAAQLFRLTAVKMSDLLRLHRARLLHAYLNPAAEPATRSRLVAEELDRRGPATALGDFCIDVARRHGFFWFTEQMRKFAHRRGALRGDERSPARATMQASERKRMKTVVAVMTRARNLREARCEMLAAHGRFMMTLAEEGKITTADLRRVLRVGLLDAAILRLDFRNGTFGYNLGGPLAKAEHERWLAVVARELARRPGGETNLEFVLRIRQAGVRLQYRDLTSLITGTYRRRARGATLRTAA